MNSLGEGVSSESAGEVAPSQTQEAGEPLKKRKWTDCQWHGSVLEVVGICVLVVFLWMLQGLPILFYHLPVDIVSAIARCSK